MALRTLGLLDLVFFYALLIARFLNLAGPASNRLAQMATILHDAVDAGPPSGDKSGAEYVIDEQEYVVLVDEHGRDVGSAPKLQAHMDGLKHRAISVLIVNARRELLLQKRYGGKYHSGGLWTNACCSHPRLGEAPISAALRRLKDEMGFAASLAPLFIVEYRAHVGPLVEDEFVHVFGGQYDGPVRPDPAEVEDYRWVGLSVLDAEMKLAPRAYTAWFLEYMRLRHHEIAAFVSRSDVG